MILEYVLLFIVVALIKKGTLKNLSETRIRVWYLFMVSLFLQVIAINLFHRSVLVENMFPLLIVGSYLVLLYGIWMNRSLPGFKLFGTGTFLNFIVIVINGGRMPISITALEQAGEISKVPLLTDGAVKHQPLTDATYLSYLADVILLRPPFVFKDMIISIGDIVITFGVSWFFYKRMLR